MNIPAKYRLIAYMVAFVLAIVCALASLLGFITPGDAQAAVVVLGIVFGGISGLAYGNVTPDK